MLFDPRGEAAVKDADLGRETQASVTVICGDCGLLFPGSLREGSPLLSDDSSGCIISRKLAEDLFGVGEAAGKRLQYGGSEYIVRGILESSEKILLTNGKESDGYHGIVLEQNGIAASEALSRLSGLLPAEGGKVLRSEGDLYAGMGKLMQLLPLGVLFLTVMGELRRRICRAGYAGAVGRLPENIWEILCPFLLAAGLLWILQVSFQFSDDYLPPAWSELSFWPGLFREKAGDLMGLLQGGLSFRDFRMLCLLLGRIGGCAGGSAVIKILASRPRDPSPSALQRLALHPERS